MENELTVTQGTALNPQEVVTNATEQAKLLMGIVEQAKCFQVISGKKYLQVEAWETIGAFNRVHAVTESITPIIREDKTVGYDAKVNLVNSNGIIVGSAIMPCYFSENACKGKEGDAKDKACKSAAQTFATSKAYRMNYSYVAILAGYQPTPAEEVGETEPHKQEHFCSIHNVPFFKKGKMKGYAHKIEGTDEWHNEDETHQNEQGTGEQSKSDRNIEAIVKIPDLQKALKEDFGLTEDQMKAELNIKYWSDLSITPKDAYLQVAKARK